MSDALEVGRKLELMCTGDGVHFPTVVLTQEIINALTDGEAIECPGCRTKTAGLPSSARSNIIYENYCN